jgi:hypothetical protein
MLRGLFLDLTMRGYPIVFIYVYTTEVNAVAYSAGFVCKVVLKGHKCVLCRHLLLKCNADYLNVKSEVFLYFML